MALVEAVGRGKSLIPGCLPRALFARRRTYPLQCTPFPRGHEFGKIGRQRVNTCDQKRGLWCGCVLQIRVPWKRLAEFRNPRIRRTSNRVCWRVFRLAWSASSSKIIAGTRDKPALSSSSESFFSLVWFFITVIKRVRRSSLRSVHYATLARAARSGTVSWRGIG